MPKKPRTKPTKKENESSSSEVVSQPCCIHNCERYGTRLLTSLRSSYPLKDDHSGRVCEGHYRRDLRRFKKISEGKKSPSLKKQQQQHHSEEEEEDEPMFDEVKDEASMEEDNNGGLSSTSTSRSVSPVHVPAFPATPAAAPFILAPPSPSNHSAMFEPCSPWELNKFRMFCDFVLRNEGMTH